MAQHDEKFEFCYRNNVLNKHTVSRQRTERIQKHWVVRDLYVTWGGGGLGIEAGGDETERDEEKISFSLVWMLV